MQVRYFNEEGLDKLDRLMKYLSENKQAFTAHWVGLSKSQIEWRTKKAHEINKTFDATKLPLVQLTWFG